MSRIYDNWERLVDATLKREQLRYLALYCESFSSTASDFSIDSLLDDVAETSGTPSNTSDSELDSLSSNVRLIEFKELKAATKSFRPDWILGTGAFGNVYKGWIDEHTLTAAKPGDGIAVAVKKLSPESGQGRREWLTQICYLRHLHHPNLVKLIGYCFEEDDLLLVYEFMQKGSLDNHLSRSCDSYFLGTLLPTNLCVVLVVGWLRVFKNKKWKPRRSFIKVMPKAIRRWWKRSEC